MCYRIQINTGIEEIAKRFNAHFSEVDEVALGIEINGFAYPATPVITNENPEIVTTDMHWGFVPHYAKDDSIRKNTLNARIETLSEKAVFSEAVENRCLIVATGYYDWRWLDEKGQNKQKHIIHSTNDEIFSFAGIYSAWKDPQTNQVLRTYAIVTTAANETMSFVHNHKLRMPVMLKSSDEKAWLDSSNSYSDFAFPKYDPGLIAFTM
jgi:putative SOS response-associated peptidase YedK